jgi:hypothetical protein
MPFTAQITDDTTALSSSAFSTNDPLTTLSSSFSTNDPLATMSAPLIPTHTSGYNPGLYQTDLSPGDASDTRPLQFNFHQQFTETLLSSSTTLTTTFAYSNPITSVFMSASNNEYITQEMRRNQAAAATTRDLQHSGSIAPGVPLLTVHRIFLSLLVQNELRANDAL